MEITYNSIKLVIVEDHKMIRESISLSLQEFKNIEIVASLTNGCELLECSKQIQIDMILCDMILPDMSGLEAYEIIKLTLPNIKILFISCLEEENIINQCKLIGGHGFIHKSESILNLYEAIRSINKGKTYFPTMRLNKKSSEYNNTKIFGIELKYLKQILSDKEWRIINLLGSGLTKNEISRQEFISLKTIDTHFTNIKNKLNLKNIYQLIHLATKIYFSHNL